MSEQQIRGPQRPRPRIAPLDVTARGEARFGSWRTDPDFFAQLMKVVPTPGQLIPDYFALCPVCLGEGCTNCFDLGQVARGRTEALEIGVFQAYMASDAYEAIAEQLPVGVRHAAELWLGNVKECILRAWREEGRITRSEANSDLYELAVPPTDAYVAEWAEVEGVKEVYAPSGVEA